MPFVLAEDLSLIPTTPILGGSQPPITLVPGNPTPFMASMVIYTCMCIHTYTIVIIIMMIIIIKNFKDG